MCFAVTRGEQTHAWSGSHGAEILIYNDIIEYTHISSYDKDAVSSLQAFASLCRKKFHLIAIHGKRCHILSTLKRKIGRN
jgi:hypothetical protein